MLDKREYVYAETKLTNDGLTTLLNDNVNFEITGYAFIDDEIIYNLFNSDNKITKGFDRVDYYAEDNVSDIKSIVIESPPYRIEPRSFLYGDPVKHVLLPDKIKTEADVIRDMEGIAIQPEKEIIAANNEKIFEFRSNILSGNFSDFILDQTQLLTWSIGVDLRGSIFSYDKDAVTILSETDNVFSKMTYTVRFHGGSVDKIFQLDLDVNPNDPLNLSTAYLKKQKGIDYDLYGTFYIFKTFVYKGIEYTSQIISFKVEKPTDTSIVMPIDGKANVLTANMLPFTSKSISTDAFFYADPPKIFGNYIADRVVNQKLITGYASINYPITLRFRASGINNFHLTVQNLGTNIKMPLLSVEGDRVDNVNYLTMPIMDLTVMFYKQVSDDGYYLMMRVFPLNDSGFLRLNDSDETIGKMHYSLFGENKYNFTITYAHKIFLGDFVTFPAKRDLDTLWYLYSSDNNLVYNQDPSQIKTMNDFETLLLNVQ